MEFKKKVLVELKLLGRKNFFSTLLDSVTGGMQI